MAIRIFTIFIASFLAVSLTPDISSAAEFGVVMDVAGKASVQRLGKMFPADFGMNLQEGDELIAGKGGSITFVTYSDCREWRIEGAGQTRLTASGASVVKGSAPKSGRQLPVCYSPEEKQGNNSGVIGGFVLRGVPQDPVKELRDEFKASKASNTALMTLIMNDLRNGRKDLAREYYGELRRRAPESAFVQNLADEFK